MTRISALNIPIRFLCVLACAASTGIHAGDDDKPVSKNADVRVLGREGRVLLSRDGKPLCVAQVRPVAASTLVMDLKAAQAILQSKAPKDQPLDNGAEQAREFVHPLGTGNARDELDVVLRARKISNGTRMLVTGHIGGPSLDDLAPGESLPPAAPLEIALQIFADQDGKAATLTYVNGQRTKHPDGEDARAEAEKRDVAGRTFSARSFTIESGPAFRVNMSRSGPVEWHLQKIDQGWLLRARLQPDPREPANIGSFILYLGGGADEGGPEATPLVLAHPQVPARDMVEGSVRIYASGADPYNLAELAVVAEVALPPRPNGDVSIKRLPCFFWEAPDDAKAEGEFRVRFAPPAEGLYGVRLVVITTTGQTRGEALPLRAGPPASPGFVHTRGAQRLFAYDDESYFVPVGVRLKLPQARVKTDDYRKMLIDLARRGINTVHLILNRAAFPLECDVAGTYDANVAAQIDDILRAAQARGIHVILGLECGDDLGRFSESHPYFREKGGPLSAPPEFFRDVKARKLYQNRLTYIAARYGAYRGILSWELIDGAERAWPALKKDPEDKTLPVGEADLSRRGRRDVMEWALEAALYLRGMDQHEHPICVSTGVALDRPWADLDKVETLDWILRQVSFPPAATDGQRDQDSDDETGMFARWIAATREPGRAAKPFLIEHIMPEKPPAALNLPALRRNIQIGSLAAGTCGVPLSEYPRSAPDGGDAIDSATPFAAALALTAAGEGKGELRCVSGEIAHDPKARYWGRCGRRGMAVFIQDPTSTWNSTAAAKAMQGIELKLPGLEEGKYILKWMDAGSGRMLKQEIYTAPAKQVDQPLKPVVIAVPDFKAAIIMTAEYQP